MKQSALMMKGATNNIASVTIQSKAEDFPEILKSIPQPPAQLHIKGTGLSEVMARPRVAIVGSRKVTAYGQAVTTQLARELARAGVVVVSGLAIGVDGIAHRAALEAGGLTVAILAGGLDHIHPSSHAQLAARIVQQGGVLISEYPEGTPSYPSNFVERNRLVSGFCQAVLITEATEKSGTLHTANFALEQGREVLAVPGNITSLASVGTNRLIKAGATPITCIADVFRALGLKNTSESGAPRGANPEEQKLIDLLAAGESEGTVLLTRSGLTITQFNQTLTMLEITGKIRSLGANKWALD